MYHTVTVDTEEDEWGEYYLTNYSVKNIDYLRTIQDIFCKYGVKPTYFVSYPVVTNERAVILLKEFLKHDLCEIGTHPHPWNIPPFEEIRSEHTSMMCNLPGKLQYAKIRCLHDAIKSNLGVNPVSFRSGRWGYDNEVSRNIYQLGYQIDSSISPYINWKQYCGPDYSNISPKLYRFRPGDIYTEVDDGEMLEVPVSSGYLQGNFSRRNAIYHSLSKYPVNKLKLIGLLDRVGLINKVMLSPETSNAEEMISLTDAMRKNGYRLLNMFFHSPSLVPGLSPYVKNEQDRMEFLSRIKKYLIYVTEGLRLESIRLSDMLGKEIS